MTEITAYKSDDGTLYETRINAALADAKYWQKKAKESEPYMTQAKEKARLESGYEGGHQ